MDMFVVKLSRTNRTLGLHLVSSNGLCMFFIDFISWKPEKLDNLSSSIPSCELVSKMFLFYHVFLYH
uniref:Uncharacterized protein n=1 Tax=Rhizophora mucronata TaxID=61149 RepID=A0A2P2Q4U5_RHIMU